jgi:excisionase family DNA binding protein
MNYVSDSKYTLPDDEIMFTTDEALQYLRISRSTMYRLIEDGTLKGHKVGAKWRFFKSDLKASINPIMRAVKK